MTEVADHLGISYESFHDWVKRYDKPTPQSQAEEALAGSRGVKSIRLG